jgi:hypothetical protein
VNPLRNLKRERLEMTLYGPTVQPCAVEIILLKVFSGSIV